MCEAAHLHGREVAVCGSLAMDEAAIPILLGLGVHELSVAPAAVPAVKARVATLDFAACRALAQRALGARAPTRSAASAQHFRSRRLITISRGAADMNSLRMPRLEGAQRLGRALMLPIAVLPAAGLLLRLGQPDLLDIAWMAAAGDAIFSNLGLLFAIGVGVGFARENHGAAGLAAVVGYVVTTKGAEVLLAVPPEALAASRAPRATSPSRTGRRARSPSSACRSASSRA